MVPTAASARIVAGLLSTGVHVAAFAAVAHATRAAHALPAGPPSAQPAAIEIASEPIVDEASPDALARVRSAVFVPLATHTQAYPVALDHDAHPHDPSLVHLPLATPARAVPDAPPTGSAASPPRFFVSVTAAPAATSAAVAPASLGRPERGGDGWPLSSEAVSSPARLAVPMAPRYPPEARARGIEADVVLGILVAKSGEVIDARVVEPAGFGFDEEALRSARAARFVPAQLDGRSVDVRMRWTVSFRLR